MQKHMIARTLHVKKQYNANRLIVKQSEDLNCDDKTTKQQMLCRHQHESFSKSENSFSFEKG